MKNIKINDIAFSRNRSIKKIFLGVNHVLICSIILRLWNFFFFSVSSIKLETLILYVFFYLSIMFVPFTLKVFNSF